MRDDQFEWDDAKAESNLRKHAVSFTIARAVFRDPFAIERLDDRHDYGEERFVVVGVVDGRLLTVTYTVRGDRLRIISARGAEPDEHRQYHEESS